MSFDAKSQFKRLHPADYEQFRPVSQQSFFLNALTHATASMAQAGASAEEMRGANRLIESLESLVADVPTVTRLPIKKLSVLDGDTADQPNEDKKA